MFSNNFFSIFAGTLLALQLVSSNPAVLSKGKEVQDDKEWCDDVLGCLEITDDWYCPTRPINVLPDTRADINTRFYLHTREAPNIGIEYTVSADDLTSLENSPFDPTKPTKFICHGFIDKGTTRWLTEVAENLLKHGDYNVIRIDWGDGSKPMYDQATANTRVVGLEIKHFVNTLIDTYGFDPANAHCIGHSLGSHTCGYGGEQIPGFGRITGLDPAGPYFTGTPYFVHLDDTDAVFVDNYHTDADSILVLGYGTGEPMGNVDIYPNSGHDQPGCDPVDIAVELITEDMINGGRDIFACSHIRSIKYFNESLFDNTCKWVAHLCYDYETFEAGNCYSCGDDNSLCTDHERIDHGLIKRSLFIDLIDVDHILRVELLWKYNDEVLHPGTHCNGLLCNRSLYVQSVLVSPISHYPESERQSFESTACSTDGSYTEIEDGSTVSFLVSTACTAVSTENTVTKK
ncbi:Pancreatic triacylglycerol lipase [Armadillidium nasatum]|uniref:Pancreatic triacylglycerol lipase n=1 Tax=Armadillidium nasatum TaxID=96803 RepID=A0A5N5TCX3_9CRUS|nr:Pancreatic triacylglycerol lipase [Armadillidium nasatum]